MADNNLPDITQMSGEELNALPDITKNPLEAYTFGEAPTPTPAPSVAPAATATPTPTLAPKDMPQVTEEGLATKPEEQKPLPSNPYEVPVYRITGGQPQQGTLHPDEVQSAIQSGRFSFPQKMLIPVFDQTGAFHTVDSEDAQRGIQSNQYTYATPKKIEHKVYNTPLQTTLAGLEGFGRGILGPVIPGIERASGVTTPEAMRARQEQHPYLYGGMEMLGFAAPALLSLGTTAAARAELEALGLTGEALEAGLAAHKANTAAKTAYTLPGALEKAAAWIPEGGSWITRTPLWLGKLAYEGALFGVQDEVTKAILNDPTQTSDTIIPAVGLSSLYGLGVGVAAKALEPVGKYLGKKFFGKATPEGVLPSVEGEPPPSAGTPPPPPKGPPPPPGSEKSEQIEFQNNLFVRPEDAKNYGAGDPIAIAKYHGPEIFPEETKKDPGFVKTLLGKVTKAVQVAPKKNIDQVEAAVRAVVKDPNFPLPLGMQTDAPPAHLLEDATMKMLGGTKEGTPGHSYNRIYNGMSDDALSLTGAYENKSNATIGAEGRKATVDSFRKLIEENNAEWKPVIDKFEELPFQGGEEAVVPLIDDLSKLSKSREYKNGSEHDAIQKTVGKIYWEVEKGNTNLHMLKKLNTVLSKEAYAAARKEDYFAMQTYYEMQEKVMQFMNDQIEKLSANPLLNADQQQQIRNVLPAYERARKGYPAFVEKFKDLGERLGLKKQVLKLGPESIIEAVEDMGEDIFYGKLKRYLEKKGGDVQFLRFINQYPELAEWLKYAKKQEIVREAQKGKSHLIAKNIFDELELHTPEELEFLFNDNQRHVLENNLITRNNFPWNKNFSNTAPELSLMEAAKFGLPGIKAHLIGRETSQRIIKLMQKGVEAQRPKFAEGGEVGMPSYSDNEEQAPDQNVLYGQKTLSNAVNQHPIAKKSVELVNNVEKASKMMQRSVASIFNPADDFHVPAPKPERIDLLKKQVDHFQQHPQSLFSVGEQMQHLPDLAPAFSSTATNALGYLTSLKPKQPTTLPYDEFKQTNKSHPDAYDHALRIAEQPLSVMNKIKNGTIIPMEVTALKSMYPKLYQNLTSQLTTQMIEHKHKKIALPYKTRIGISMFMGQPLDSTMTPQALQAIQNVNGKVSQQAQQGGGGPATPQGGRHNLSPLDKMANMAQTPLQRRAQEASTK